MNSETTTSGQLHLSQRTVRTPRLTTNIWVAGPEDGTPLLLVHGNMSTGGFWEYVAKELPDSVRVIAPDLRGFGATDPLPVDATRGLGDMVDDVRSLLEQRGLTGQQRVHTVGWSLGAGVLQQYALAYPDDLATMTWVAPVSPYGYGGTKDTAGTWCHDDAAGSGAGIANPAVVQRLADKDASADGTQTSPRHVMVSLYGPGQNAANVDEEFLVQQLLTTVTGVDNYPGDALESPNWPMAAPGTKGVLNTISPKYFNTSALVGLGRKPPITWVHGGCDQVIGDARGHPRLAGRAGDAAATHGIPDPGRARSLRGRGRRGPGGGDARRGARYSAVSPGPVGPAYPGHRSPSRSGLTPGLRAGADTELFIAQGPTRFTETGRHTVHRTLAVTRQPVRPGRTQHTRTDIDERHHRAERASRAQPQPACRVVPGPPRPSTRRTPGS